MRVELHQDLTYLPITFQELIANRHFWLKDKNWAKEESVQGCIQDQRPEHQEQGKSVHHPVSMRLTLKARKNLPMFLAHVSLTINQSFPMSVQRGPDISCN